MKTSVATPNQDPELHTITTNKHYKDQSLLHR